MASPTDEGAGGFRWDLHKVPGQVVAAETETGHPGLAPQTRLHVLQFLCSVLLESVSNCRPGVGDGINQLDPKIGKGG